MQTCYTVRDMKSRMNREVHVRFCEKLGGRFPLLTRPLRLSSHWSRNLPNTRNEQAQTGLERFCSASPLSDLGSVVKKIILLTIACFCLGKAFAVDQTANYDLYENIDVIAKEEIKNSGTPSLQIAIGYKDRIVYEKAFGFSDLENQVSASTETKYRTASIAKWFTATSAMTLVEDGLLDLDKPVQEYCPSFPKKRWDINARQLLTHTAGIRGYFDFDELIQNSKDPKEIEKLQKKQLREELSLHTRYDDVIKPLDLFKDDPLIFEPASDWSYTSFGYRILACVMQGASDQEFQTLMEESIFKKSKMKNTIPDDAWAIVPSRAAGYRLHRDKSIRRADLRDVSENLPAGGYLSTASDLVRFALMFNRGLLTQEFKELMTSPVIVDYIDLESEKGWRDAMPNRAMYGYGVMLWSKYVPGMAGHTGRQAGAASILVLIPNKELSIAVMSNAKGWNGYLNFVMRLVDAIEKEGGVASLNKSIQPSAKASAD